MKKKKKSMLHFFLKRSINIMKHCKKSTFISILPNVRSSPSVTGFCQLLHYVCYCDNFCLPETHQEKKIIVCIFFYPLVVFFIVLYHKIFFFFFCSVFWIHFISILWDEREMNSFSEIYNRLIQKFWTRNKNPVQF